MSADNQHTAAPADEGNVGTSVDKGGSPKLADTPQPPEERRTGEQATSPVAPFPSPTIVDATQAKVEVDEEEGGPVVPVGHQTPMEAIVEGHEETLPEPEPDDDLPPPDAGPDPREQRLQERLKRAFEIVRCFRRRKPAVAWVLKHMVLGGNDRAEAERVLGQFVPVVQAALNRCGKRSAALVLAAIELRCRQGHRRHTGWDIEKLTGQRRDDVLRGLLHLSGLGIVDLKSFAPRSNWRFELISPLLTAVEQQPWGLFADGLDLLRIDDQQLGALPYDDLKGATVDAVVQATEDDLKKQEAALVAEIARCNENEAAYEVSLQVIEEDLQAWREHNQSLDSALSDVRWWKRHPSMAQLEHEGGEGQGPAAPEGDGPQG